MKSYKKIAKLLMMTMMTGGMMLMGQSAMAAPAQPQVHVDSATKDMRGHVASKILDVKADKTEVGPGKRYFMQRSSSSVLMAKSPSLYASGAKR